MINLKYLRSYKELTDWLTETQRQFELNIQGLTQDSEGGYTVMYSVNIKRQIIG